MQADTGLIYCPPNWQETLQLFETIEDNNKKMVLEPHPDEKVLVAMAKLAYTDCTGKLNLPKGWQLLTTARNNSWRNGYFGCAFWNPSEQQIAIAHRGTDPSKFGPLWVDGKGVYFNSYTNHMSSGVTFANTIKEGVLKTNQQPGSRIVLSFTGHSLGAWMAGVTTLTVKLLKREVNSDFFRVASPREGLHAHTLALDSPGVKDMLVKIQRDYDERYDRSICIKQLDITTILATPNRVNCTGFHVGDVYQLENVNTHSIDNFIKAFDEGNKKLAVQNWPEGLVEREGYDELEMYILHSKDLKDPSTSSSGSDQTTQPLKENAVSAHTEEIQIPWKYRTKSWLGNTCHLGVFSVEELNFISNWSLFQSNTIMKLTKIEKFTDKKKLKKLDVPPFEIHTNRNIITCKTPEHLKKVIGLTKQLLRWFPSEIMKAVTKQNKSIKGAPLYMAGRAYLCTLPDILNCEDTLGLESFLESSEQVLQIETCDPKFEAARLKNILLQIENTSLEAKYLKENCQTFLCWKDYVSIAKDLDIECLNGSDVTIDNLLVLQFSSTNDNLHPNYDVLIGILKNLVMCSHKKLVIILSHPIDWQNLMDLELTIVTKPRKVFELNDLTPTSRDYIFARDAIAIGEETLSLGKLLGDVSKSSDKINQLLSPILKKLATDPQFKAKIERKLPKLCQSDSLSSKGTKRVDKTKIVTLLQRSGADGPLLVISDPDQLSQEYWGQVAEAVQGRIYTSEEDGQSLFLEKCGEEPARVIYWLYLCAEGLTLKEVYNSSLYMSRKFHTRFIIESMDKFVRYSGHRDKFIFIDVEDKLTFISYFKLSKEAEELFVLKDHFKIQIRSPELNIGSLNDEESINKHFFKMLEIEGNPCLVWQYSHGSLDGLRPFITRDYSDPIVEDVFSNTRKKLTIIADDPGMGKTTSLTRISELIRDSWILRIDHNHLTAIDKLPSKLTLQPVTKCLIHASGLSPDDDLLSSLLKHCLEENSSRQVCIMVDAFDEITKENTKVKMLQLLKYLRNFTNCETVVTSRVYPQESLENELSEFSVQLDKITETEQEDYMMNSWLPHLDLELPEHGVSESEKERLRKFARELREEVKGVLKEDVASFLGIPLQIRMLAEVFLQQAIQYVVSPEQAHNSCKITNLFDLYNRFIEVKKSIYFEQKNIFNKGLPDSFINDMVTKIMENHCVLAFQSLDPKFAAEYFTNTIISDQQLKDISGLGLIGANIGGTFPFIHRTFEEYFCADFLVQRLRQGRPTKEHIKLVKDELCVFLLRPEYYLIRQFVESQLNTSPPIPSDVLENNLMFYQYWSANRQLFFHDRVKTPLHIAADEQNRHTFAVLLSGPSNRTSEEAYITLMAARDKAGRTALKIALENGNRDIIKQITENVEGCSYESLLKVMLANFVDFEGDRDHNLFSEYSSNTQQSNSFKKALMRTEQIRKLITPFMAAVKEDDYCAVQEILDGMESDIERSHLVIAIDSQGDTAINLVASKTDKMLFKLFAKQGVCMSYDKHEQNPLHCAAKNGHISTVSFLLNQSKENYNSIKTIKEHNHYSEEAPAFSHTGMYKMFSSIKTKDGSTALQLAAQGGHYDIVKELAAIGADIHTKNNDGWTALIQAACNGYLEVVELLLMNGADLNCQNVDGDSALFCAAKNGHLATVHTLLEKGADIRTVSNDGWTALMQAVNGGHMEVVELLLSNGADLLPELNSQNKNGFSALLDAGFKGHYDIVGKLLEKGADIHIRDINGRTALMLAASKGHLEIVELLLLNGAVLNSQSQGGYSALLNAVLNGHLATVRTLLEKGADIHAINNKGWTALMIAASTGHLEALELLLMNGADLNFQNADGDSALSCAANNSRLTTVCTLLEKGADINSGNKEDWTALQQAVNIGGLEVINILSINANLSSELKIHSEEGYSALKEYIDIRCKMLEKKELCKMEFFKTKWMQNKKHMETAKLRSNTVDSIPELNSRDENGLSNLLDAVLKGQCDIVRTLLEKGADIQMKNINGRTALMLAASEGHIEVVELLLLNGTDMNSQDQCGALLEAVFNGHLAIVRKLLEKGADIHISNANGRTALMLAASDGYLEIVELLLLNGAYLNSRDEDGYSALQLATFHGHIATICRLLEKGADIHIRDITGRTALMLAASEGHLEVVELLLLNGAVLNSQDEDGYSALLNAVFHGHLAIVRTLLEKGADIHAINNDGRTALIRAASNGYLEVVELLLLKGADLNSRDEDGYSALQLATFNGHLTTVCKLLEKGADIHIKSNYGRTALILTAEKGHTEVVEVLLSNGADLNSRDEDGYTALQLATNNGHLATVCKLLEKGADIHIRDITGRTALMLAASEGHIEVVELLLLNGADLNSQDKVGNCALLFAAFNGYLATVSKLLEKGADIHIRNNNGRTALMLAAEAGHPEVVELLLLNGADLNSQDKSGNCALLLAVFKGHLATVSKLLEKGADIHTMNNDGNTALMLAAGAGRLKAVELLLLNGAVLNSQDENGYSALLKAVLNGHLATVSKLLEKGADIHLRDNEGRNALMLAASKGYLEIIELLLLNGVDLNSRDEDGDSALVDAAFNGHLATVRKLLEKGADIDLRNNKGRNALMLAASKGYLEIVELLLLNGADLNSRDEDGYTALQLVTFNGHLATVCKLLEKGADIRTMNNYGSTALMLAAGAGHLEVVELLLLNGAYLNSQDEAGTCALLLAAIYGHLATVSKLLEKGADIHIRNNKGRNAIMLAASKGYLEVVELLSLNGADLNSQDEDGDSALLKAVLNGHLATVRTLLEKGADIHKRMNNGWTALMQAVNGGHLEVVELLLSNGADLLPELNSQNNNGFSALLDAVLKGHCDIVSKLLEKGADIHIRNKGWTALNYAAGYGHLEVTKLLLRNGADLNSQDEDGDTAFLQAAAGGHTEIVVLLLQRGVDINSQRDDGRSALSWAALNGHKNVVEVLLQHNADVSCQDKDGKTALSWAVENIHGEVVDLLRSHQEAEPMERVSSLISEPPSSDNNL